MSKKLIGCFFLVDSRSIVPANSIVCVSARNRSKPVVTSDGCALYFILRRLSFSSLAAFSFFLSSFSNPNRFAIPSTKLSKNELIGSDLVWSNSC